jgi:hypothetical protein
MRRDERAELRRDLDREMRPYREAAREENPTRLLLRAIRQALEIPVAEAAQKMGVRPSVVFELERSEGMSRITLQGMTRLADALGCEVVYGIVPKQGRTFRQMAEEQRAVE